MLRSLFSGVSGLRAHQTMMDVVGNNIANVNTAGYKSSQTVFEDTLSQMLQAAGAPQNGNGGINPAQVGLGSRLAAITTNFTQGATQSTGRDTDLMIQGDGFFIVNNAGEQLYTRAGAFAFDTNGRLVAPDGSVVQGWTATNGVVNTNNAITGIQLPLGTVLPPTATSGAAIGGNLPAGAADGDEITTSMPMFDAQGTESKWTFTFTYDETAGNWSLAVKDGTGAAAGTSTLSFNADGSLATGGPLTFTSAAGQAIQLDIGALSNFGGEATIQPVSQNGSAMGTLSSYSISPSGVVIGVFSNGLKQPLAQIAIADFNNPAGLEKVGGSKYRASVNSGMANLGVAGAAGRGLLASGALEMSNVDLAQEFTNLIIAERGFQANSKVITTSDEILQDLVNLKR